MLMVRMINSRNTDTLNLNEFHAMMIYIDRWRKMFNLFDIDGNNSIDIDELKEALYRLKLQISDRIIQLLLKKYSRNCKYLYNFYFFFFSFGKFIINININLIYIIIKYLLIIL